MKTAYDHARAEIGVTEWAEGTNPRVKSYYHEAGASGVSDDAVPWCAAFVGAMLTRAGQRGTGSLAARSYLKWGTPVALADARPGDVVILWRGARDGWQGHVAFFVREDPGGDLILLGGNQADQVCEMRYGRGRLLGIRRAELIPPSINDQVQPARGLGAILAALAAILKGRTT